MGSSRGTQMLAPLLLHRADSQHPRKISLENPSDGLSEINLPTLLSQLPEGAETRLKIFLVQKETVYLGSFFFYPWVQRFSLYPCIDDKGSALPTPAQAWLSRQRSVSPAPEKDDTRDMADKWGLSPAGTWMLPHTARRSLHPSHPEKLSCCQAYSKLCPDRLVFCSKEPAWIMY